MAAIDPLKLQQFRAYAPGAGARELTDIEKQKTVDNNISVISFFDKTGPGAAKPFLKAEWSPIEDKGKIELFKLTNDERAALAADPAKFEKLLDDTIAKNQAYFRPAFGTIADAPTRYKHNGIVGLRIEQFRKDAVALCDSLYNNRAQLDRGLTAVNTKARDLGNQKIEFDTFEINGYGSFGHDAAFIHIYEKALDDYNATDVGLLAPEERRSVERKKKQLQGELDAIFRSKYVYNSSSMFEVNAEVSVGLCLIDRNSRQRVSEVAETLDGIVPHYEILNVVQNGQSRAVFYDHDEKKYFFDRSSEPVPADLVPQIQRKKLTPAEESGITFRRAVSGEQLRKNVRFDWDQNGYVAKDKIDWVSWGGHCNDKAALEAAGVCFTAEHPGVMSYNGASGKTVAYNRDLLNEGLLSFSELGTNMSRKNGGQAVRDIGETQFAAARDDDRPDRLVLSNGRRIPLARHEGALEIISATGADGKVYNRENLFREYAVADDKKSATKNPLYKSTDEGDFVSVDLAETVVKAKVLIESIDLHSGYPTRERKEIVLDFKNPPDQPILIDSVMQSAADREMYEISLDLKKSEWIAQRVRVTKGPDGKFKKENVGEPSREKFDPKKLVGQSETSLDNPATWLPFVDDAMKTGKNGTAETADGAGVWNGRMLTLEKALEMREGGWERVAVNVSARYGGNSGKFLAKLNAKGEHELLVPLALPADFFWRQKIVFAPEAEGLVNTTALERGLVSVENGTVRADALNDMMELIWCAFNGIKYTLVHEGKRYLFDDEASWKAEVEKLEALRKACYVDGPVDPVGPGELLKDAGTVAKGTLKQFQVVAEADGPITIALETTSGDADLYAKRGGAATDKDHTYKSWNSDLSADSLVVEAKKGEVIGIAVHGYKQSDFSLKVTGPRVGAPPAPPAPAGLAVHEAGTVKQNIEHRFEFVAPRDGEIRAVMSGSGDADLYLRIGGAPTTTRYDARPYTETTAETAVVKVKAGDKVYGMVRGYAPTSDFDLNVTYV